MNLKAAIFDMEKEAKKQKREPRAQVTPLGGKNKGIENRIQRDLAELRRSVGGSGERDPYQMLRKKAELYQQLLSGELLGTAVEDSSLIDFEEAKRRNEEEHNFAEPNEQFLSHILQNSELVSEDMEREANRVEWERQALDEMIEERTKLEHSKAIHDEAQRTLEARIRVQQIRNQRRRKTKRRIAKIKSLKEKQAAQAVTQQQHKWLQEDEEKSDDDGETGMF